MERDFVERLPNRARAIRVVRKPEEAAATVESSSPGQWGTLIDLPTSGRSPPERRSSHQHESFIKVPPTMNLGIGSGEHFALKIQGDSMIDAGILDGDMGIFRRQQTAESGQIVIAFIDSREATLKRFRPQAEIVELVPANKDMEPIVVHPSQLQIRAS